VHECTDVLCVDHIDDPTIIALPSALKRSKSVQFNVPSPEGERFYPRKGVDYDEERAEDSPSPERQRKPERRIPTQNKLRKKRRPSDEAVRPRAASASNNNSSSSNRKRRSRSTESHRRHRSASPSSSDETIVLPDRFDREGRKKPERGDDPLADRIQDLLGGQGTMGKLLYRFTGDLLGSSGGGGGKRR